MRTIHATGRRFIGILYSRLLADENGAGGSCFRTWRAGWEAVHGRLERKRAVDRNAMARLYSICPDSVRLPELLFSIETYYVYRMRLSAFAALSGSAGAGNFLPSEHLDGNRFRDFLENLAVEETFRKLGVRNYSDGGLFGWFPSVLSGLELDLLRQETLRILAFLRENGHATDSLRHVYHELVPNSVRHTTGAYYTPGWLADYILDNLGFDGAEPETVHKRLLDPTCGSGTFLMAAIARAIRSGRLGGLSDTGILESILSNIFGFDIDPVAVLAARTNYLSMVCRLLPKGVRDPGEEIRIPVFQCDSVLVPERPAEGTPNRKEEGDSFHFRLGGESFTLPERLFHISAWRGFVDDLVEDVLHRKVSSLRRYGNLQTRGHGRPGESADGVAALFHFLRNRNDAGALRPCAEMLRDLPESLFCGRFDVLAGNPPWVNWEYLPPAYRSTLQPLWPQLGLFDLKRGTERAFSKEDVSALVTCAAGDRYLKDGGRMGFLLPQSLFKSSLNGRGFRKFRLGTRGPDLRVVQVDDFTELKPFEGTANRTVAAFIERGAPTGFPVSYRKWSPSGRRRSIAESLAWKEVKEQVAVELLHAVPTDAEDPASCWMTAKPGVVSLLHRLSGKCPYRARTGVFTGGANGVFYLDVLETRADGTLVAANVPERAKRRVAPCRAIFEPDYVFPLLRGRDVAFWKHTISRAILCPHTAESGMHAVDAAALQKNTPHTLAYLQGFRDVLLERKGFSGWERQFLEESFYACQRIGSYTFAPYKVVWRYICREFRCCVVGPSGIGDRGDRPVIPHEKLMILGFQDPEEAYYACGVLSSTPVRFFIESRMVATQIGPHVISQLALPAFDRGNALQRRVAAECLRGHASRAEGADGEARSRLESIDDLVSGVLPVGIDEIADLRASFPSPFSS